MSIESAKSEKTSIVIEKLKTQIDEIIKTKSYLRGKGVDDNFLDNLHLLPGATLEKTIKSLLSKIVSDVQKEGLDAEILQTDYSDDETFADSLRTQIISKLLDQNPKKYFEEFEFLSEYSKNELKKIVIQKLNELTTVNAETKTSIVITRFKNIEKTILKNIAIFNVYERENIYNIINSFYNSNKINKESFKNRAYQTTDGSLAVHEFNLIYSPNSIKEIENSRKVLTKKLINNKENFDTDKREELFNNFLAKDPIILIKLVNREPNYFENKTRDEIVSEVYITLVKNNPKEILNNFKYFELIADLYNLIKALIKARQIDQILKYYDLFPEDLKNFADSAISSTQSEDFADLEISPKIIKFVQEKFESFDKLENRFSYFLKYFKFFTPEMEKRLIDELIINSDYSRLIDILTEVPTIDIAIQEKILDEVLDSRFVPRLEPILSKISREYQDKLNEKLKTLYVKRENLLLAGQEIIQKGEDKNEETQKIYLEVLDGLKQLLTISERISGLQEKGMEKRVLKHLEMRYEKTISETRLMIKRLEAIGLELGGLNALETLAFLQKKLNEIIASCEIFHGTKPELIINLLRDPDGRFKHAIEFSETKSRGQVNADIEQEHFGEAYTESENRNPYLIFGYLSQNTTGKEEMTSGYGPIRIKFNRDNISDRTTIYQGDTSGNSFQKFTPQILNAPHVSFILDQIRYKDPLPTLEELCLNEDFISKSVVTTIGFGFVEAQIHQNAYLKDIEEIFIDQNELNKYFNFKIIKVESSIKEIREEVEKVNKRLGTNIKVTLV